ncbi:unnamed protein product, partial [Mesorhabditis spiculigera]
MKALLLLFLFASFCCAQKKSENTTKAAVDATVPLILKATLPPLPAAQAVDRGRYLGDDEIPTYEPDLPEEDEQSDEREGDRDSDVSEERKEEDFIDRPTLDRVPHPEVERPDVVSVISSAFNNRKTFSCPKIKTDLLTGTSIGDLSPEDVGIIASMGDAVATGEGLWPQTDIEFRGAAFPIGGDATIDGLVTIPNILREFNPRLTGVSHGMGTRDQLPAHQLSVAVSNATSSSMPEQATELVRRIKILRDADFNNEWVMVIITIGTQEVCAHCRGPDVAALQRAIDILSMGLPKALVVLLGPVHVSSAFNQKANLLKTRCSCSRNQSGGFMDELSDSWQKAFQRLQKDADEHPFKRPTFGLLAIPMLTITSRFPYGLFMKDRPLLNRRGHNYATKWLWNRLIAGDKYNLSSATLSQDSYYCPSTGCPYFRTTANARACQLLSLTEAKDTELTLGSRGKVLKKPRRTVKKLYTIAACIVVIAFCVVITVGTIFYQKSKQSRHGRFEIVDEAQKKFEEAKAEEEKALIQRANSRLERRLETTNDESSAL